MAAAPGEQWAAGRSRTSAGAAAPRQGDPFRRAANTMAADMDGGGWSMGMILGIIGIVVLLIAVLDLAPGPGSSPYEHDERQLRSTHRRQAAQAVPSCRA